MHGPAPSFPDVPEGEWHARIAKAQGLMLENGIDLLVLWGDKNIRYFSGYTSTHWNMISVQPLVVLLPAEGDATAIAAEFFRTTVESQSWIRDIRCPVDVDEHSEAVIRRWPAFVAAEIKELGFAKARIALEQGEQGGMYIPRPLNDILLFKDELDQAEFVDGDGVIWGCRGIKSPLEIDRLTTAASIHREAMSAAVQRFEPGMTESDVGKLFICAAYEAGAEMVVPGNIMCGAAKEGMLDTWHSFEGAAIGRDDYLELDLALSYRGYWADMARVLSAGPVSEAFAARSHAMRESFEAMVEAARPGLPVTEWQRVYFESGGCETPDELAGHGIGMDVHEPPIVTRDSEAVLEPGMTFEIEPFIVPGGWRTQGGEGMFHYENLVVITDSGAVPVYTLHPEILQVSNPIA